MRATPLSLSSVVMLEPEVFSDARGFFFESFNQARLAEALGFDATFVQDNHSCTSRGGLRGLHYQVRQPQGKLVRVVRGEIFDVVVDLRKSSPGFGRWLGEILSADNRRQLWIPAGFAHGFLALSGEAEVLYKTTDYYAPQFERCIAWNDPDIAVEWPLATAPMLSVKDQAGLSLRSAEVFA
ncbi:MAG: dTDP-4-dehydrorhamnose 3,5-epimerase [Polaromonas sp.]|nr:dTDP-4-dehydrorhamnose 3,5-epimerase [Polaromonas sp.]